MTIQISTEVVGQRVYVVGNTYAIRDRLKQAGCHWDGDRRQWWVGRSKAAEIAALVRQVDGAEAPRESLDDRRVYARVEYKGRSYYVIGEGNGRVRLTVLDGSLDFWADREACKLIKRYESRTRFAGYSRGQVEVHQTLGGLRRFVAQSRRAEQQIARGEIPDGYCVDHEDGAIKRISECDIPSV